MKYQCWICGSGEVSWIDPTGIASWCADCLERERAKARGDRP